MKLSSEEVEEAIHELVKQGWVKDSGERRDGKIVWCATDKGLKEIEDSGLSQLLKGYDDGTAH